MTDPGRVPIDPTRLPPPAGLTPPPGNTPSVAVPGRMHRIKGLAVAIEVLLIVSIPLDALSVVGLVQVRDAARGLLDGTVDESSFEHTLQLNVGVLSGLLVIPIAVLTIIVMFRMAQDLERLGRHGRTWKPGWAIAGWFVPPCAIYVVPWLMFRELWRGSDPDVAPGDPTWRQRPVHRIVDVWWVLYGLVPIVGFGSSVTFVAGVRDLDDTDLAQELVDSFARNWVLSLVSVITAVVFLVMMRLLTRRHMRATGEVPG